MKYTHRMVKTIFLGLAALLILPARAFTPSAVQQEVLSVSGTANLGGIQTVIPTIFDNASVEGLPTTDSGYVILSQVTRPLIKITPLSQTILANEGISRQLSYEQRVNMETESGLTYIANQETNLVYHAVTAAEDTARFLSKLPGDVSSQMEQLIAEKTAAARARLEQSLSDAQEQGDTATVEALQQQLAAMEHDSYLNVNNYAPLALFDVSASSALVESMGEGDYVEVSFELNSVDDTSDLIALHFHGTGFNTDEAQEMLETNFEQAILEFEVEILDVQVKNGIATIALRSFSPVMLMTRVETTANTHSSAPQVSEEVATSPSEQAAVSHGFSSLTAGIAVGSLMVMILLLFLLFRKKKGKNKTSVNH